MILNCETILSFYTHKNRNVYCVIKVKSQIDKFRNTCRYLSQKQWMTFDKELDKILTKAERDYWDCDRVLKFNINPYTEVKVKKSKVSLNYFYKCLYRAADCTEGAVEDVNQKRLFLECTIDFKLQVTPTLPNRSQEYEPQVETLSDSPLEYEPYKPSKKLCRTKEIVETSKSSGEYGLEYNGETYSPKPLLEKCVAEPLLAEVIPKYTPAPINGKRKSMESYNVLKKTNASIDKHILLGKNVNKISKAKAYEYIPKCQESVKTTVPVYIPTPIDEINRNTVFNWTSVRNNRKRSKTIDVCPEELIATNAEETEISSLIANDVNKNLKTRSLSIDEVPSLLANIPPYIPTPLPQIQHENILKPCNYKQSKNKPNTTDVISEKLETSFKEKLNSKKKDISRKEDIEITMKNSSKTSVDNTPVEPKSKKKTSKVTKKLNETNKIFLKELSALNEADVFTSSALSLNKAKTTQTVGNDNLSSLATEVRKDKYMKVQVLITNEQLIQSEPERLIEKQLNLLNDKSNESISMHQLKAYTLGSEQVAAEGIKRDGKVKRSNSYERNKSKGLIKEHRKILDDKKLKARTQHLLDSTLGCAMTAEKDRRNESYSMAANKSLNRTQEPLSMSQRFLKEKHNLLNKKQKSSQKTKELFGSDDDDDYA